MWAANWKYTSGANESQSSVDTAFMLTYQATSTTKRRYLSLGRKSLESWHAVQRNMVLINGRHGVAKESGAGAARLCLLGWESCWFLSCLHWCSNRQRVLTSLSVLRCLGLTGTKRQSGPSRSRTCPCWWSWCRRPRAQPCQSRA